MDKKKVLVVDDDPGMVETLCDILELHGWETIRGFDGEAAVKLAMEHDVDILLMDVRMPRMSGVDALRAIRQKRPRAQTVLMTAYASQDVLAEAERHGVLRIMRKPLDLPELVSVLEGAREE
jgi:DNA-binding NtrC family response regulator